MAFSFEDISINTIIGSDSFVSGNIKINGFVRVDGDIDGKIEASGNVIIGNKARVRGNISASSIVVGGIVEGDISAPNGIKLLSNSIVLGDIYTKSLLIEENVIFNGHCICLSNQEQFETRTKSYIEQKEIQEKVI